MRILSVFICFPIYADVGRVALMVSNAHRYSLTYNVRHIHLYHSLPLAALPLIALTVASFGIGTTKFVLMGLLPEISRNAFLEAPCLFLEPSTSQN